MCHFTKDAKAYGYEKEKERHWSNARCKRRVAQIL
jgi:hypothetical protein